MPPDSDTEFQQELETARNRTGLDMYREAQDDAVARHSDATTKIAEADTAIHDLETELHNKQRDLKGWQKFREHQEKRQRALERKILAGRQFIRAVEDDELGID